MLVPKLFWQGETETQTIHRPLFFGQSIDYHRHQLAGNRAITLSTTRLELELAYTIPWLSSPAGSRAETVPHVGKLLGRGRNGAEEGRSSRNGHVLSTVF